MAVSRNSGHGQDSSFRGPFTDRLSRYDLLLAAIPVVLGVGVLLGAVTAVPFHLGVAVGSLIGALLVADAVYLHPPTESASGDSYAKSD